MTDSDEESEFEIKPLLRGGFRAILYTFRRGRWWPPESRICVSEREAMVWINSRLTLRGFAEAYEWGQGAVETEGQASG
ncbi:hypothetical protein SAMN05444161_9300 [Rhizobiales bacterium GAS191]|nr:hypothetical protein SAMN05444161_9300 [Rhizobiales bacterium GAS191]